MIAHYILGSVLFIYALALVLFDNPVYIKYLHIINITLLAGYIYVWLISPNYRIRFSPLVSRYMLLTAFGAMNILWADNQDMSLDKSLTMSLITINIFIIYNLLCDYDIQDWLLAGIIIGVVINALVSFNIIDIGWESSEGWRFQGTTVKSNILANICIFGVVASLYFYIKKSLTSRLFGVLGVLTSMYVVILTASKKGIIVTFLVIVIFFLLKSNRLYSIAIVTLLGVGLYFFESHFNFYNILISSSNLDVHYILGNLENRFTAFMDTDQTDNSTEARIQLINRALEMWYSNPLKGQGLGAFQNIYGAYAHNNYVDILANLGLVGFFIYYSIYWSIFSASYRIKKMNDTAILFFVFVIIMMLMEFAIVSYSNKTLMMFLLIASVMIERQYKSKENETNRNISTES